MRWLAALALLALASAASAQTTAAEAARTTAVVTTAGVTGATAAVAGDAETMPRRLRAAHAKAVGRGITAASSASRGPSSPCPQSPAPTLFPSQY